MAYTTIKKSTDYFNTITWTGNDSARSLTGVGYAPDLVWIKDRSETNGHALFDKVRGVNEYISTSSTGAQLTTPSSGYVSAFDSDGFSGVTGSSSYANWNKSGNNYVGWNWKANGAGSTNSVGSLDSTVSVNTTAGFSIVKWTNGTSSVQTVGHGLGVVPKMIIMKVLGSTGSWNTYHNSIGNTHGLYFNSTAVSEDNVAFWNDTSPTSTVFTTGTNGNLINNTLIAYCFAEVKGFSKFSQYIGNGNDDGPFVYTGFKPAFIIMKNTQQGGDDWILHNNKFPGFNDNDQYLYSNTTNAQIDATTLQLDILSNGFKIRKSTGAFNNSGEKMVYMAFASEPLVGDNPATAR